MTIQEAIDFVLLVIVLIIGIVCYTKLTKAFRVLTFTIPVTLLFDSLSKLSAHLYKTNALVLHLECLALYILYAMVYYHLFRRKKIKKFTFASTIAIVVFAVINAIFLQPLNRIFPSYLYIVSNTMLVIFSVLLFRQMLLFPTSINITSQGIFWFNTSMLFFSTTMFLNLALTNYWAEHKYRSDMIYDFWYASYYILNILTGVALICNRKEDGRKMTA